MSIQVEPTIYKGARYKVDKNRRNAFTNIIHQARLHLHPRAHNSAFTVINIDGPPGVGKSTVAKQMANFINTYNYFNAFGVLGFADILKTDEMLLGVHRDLYHADPAVLESPSIYQASFWYDFARLETIIRDFFRLPPGEAMAIDNLYCAGRHDLKRTFMFPQNRENFLIIEGCYSLNESLGHGMVNGIFVWVDETSRYSQFITRAAVREASKNLFGNALPITIDDATIYQIFSACFRHYLFQSQPPVPEWQLSVDPHNRYLALNRVSYQKFQQVRKMIAQEMQMHARFFLI